MLTVSEIVDSKKRNQQKPGEVELRRLPDRKALIHGRLSGFSQVRDSKESVREIAAQVGKAIEDGYKTSLDRDMVEAWLGRIQAGEEPPGVMEEGEVIVNCLGLGISGTLPEDKRPDLQLTMNLLRESELGAIYVTEGANRLSRDPDRVVSATLLKLMKDTNCKLRTPYEVLSPCVERDWEVIHDELERGAEELKSMSKRLCWRRKLKAARGEYVGEPILPGFMVPIIEIRSNGSRVYGKYQRYAPHAEIVKKILREYIRQRFSEMKTHSSLGKLVFPFFPPELEYMEALTSLRIADKTDAGYIISPSMISSLATNLKLIGISIWGDTEPILDNHEKAVPLDLFLEAYDGAKNHIKPRGPRIRHEPLEWAGLLWFDNHGVVEKVSHHSVKEAYRSQVGYVKGRGPSVFNIAARHLDIPLTNTVLRQLKFTPFAEEVLMQLEADTAHSSLELEERKKNISRLDRRLENLEGRLGWDDGKHDEVLLKQIERTRHDMEELRSQPVPTQSTPEISYKMVRDFLSGLPQKWYNYSRTLRNRLLGRLIDRVILRQKGQIVEATIQWKTGQTQAIEIQRARAKGNRESHWKTEEFDILRKLWPNGSREMILAKLHGRTWKAVAHQAYNLGLRRSPELSNHTPRPRWETNEEDKARQLYEAGTPITDIASSVNRSQTAVLQRASEKKWQRLDSDQRMVGTELSGINQNPEVPKGISSGLLFWGQVRTLSRVFEGSH